MVYERKLDIIIPTYNSENFFYRMLDSLLLQTYIDFRLIIVNDGSTDATEGVVYKYRPLFEKKGCGFYYIKQKNLGLAAAINTGLLVVNAKYLMWLDDDDFLEPSHIEEKVNFLDKNPSINLVRCNGNVFSENDLKTKKREFNTKNSTGNLFEDILFSNLPPANGLNMLRTQALWDCLPQRQIYPSKVGQNMQLLLPVAFLGKNGFIDEYLFNYVERDSSHSHSIKGGIAWKERFDMLDDMKLHVIDGIPMDINYKNHIKQILSAQTFISRIRAIDEQIDKIDSNYVRNLCERFFEESQIKKNLNGRKLFFWGLCPLSQKLNGFLNKYCDVQCEGYIDSNQDLVNRCKKELAVKTVFELDSTKMFVIVPIRLHYDIVNNLDKNGFKNHDDFFYPEYDLRLEMDNYDR